MEGFKQRNKKPSSSRSPLFKETTEASLDSLTRPPEANSNCVTELDILELISIPLPPSPPKSSGAFGAGITTAAPIADQTLPGITIHSAAKVALDQSKTK